MITLTDDAVKIAERIPQTKRLTAEKVKRLQPGTVVFAVKDSTEDRALFLIVKSGKKKLLKGALKEHEIKDMPGLHYEVIDESK